MTLVDKDGKCVAPVYDYFAYGKQIAESTSPQQVTQTFTGKELDLFEKNAATGEDGEGLYYFGARYYDAEIGVWTSIDPKEQFFNLYMYTNNPVNSVDPDEQWVEALWSGLQSYMNGIMSNDGETNPFKWDWSNPGNWFNALGAVVSIGKGIGNSIYNKPIDVYQLTPNEHQIAMDKLINEVEQLDAGNPGKDVQLLVSLENDELNNVKGKLLEAWKKISAKAKSNGLNPVEPNLNATTKDILISWHSNKNRIVFWHTHGGGGSMGMTDGTIYPSDFKKLSRGVSLKYVVQLSCYQGEHQHLWSKLGIPMVLFYGSLGNTHVDAWLNGKPPHFIRSMPVLEGQIRVSVDVGLREVLNASK
ncbi:MAG: RHS repeat-associated core domain-containing protein [Fibrobacter sp.]|nr:RHS repeat-associated core domain-containing protein [Fibrobacter sp.]